MLMDYEKLDIVEEKDYLAVMKPWSAFSACDINNDNELSTEEMEKLFWLCEGQRPLISRVQHDMKTIDADGSGTIDRIEWMMYLVTPDPSSKLETYDLHLRSLFDKFDLDRNGKIDQEELEEFL
jgi:Ca2+-binding EF-hand superfamily protein